MYSDKIRGKTILITVLLAVAVIAGALAYWSIDLGNRRMQEESAVALKQAIVSSARQCYIVEGVYPSDLAYLEDSYGLQINREDYFITYDAFAQNLPPTVKVTTRK